MKKNINIVVEYTIFATTKIDIMRKLDFVSLQVRDLEASKSFYTDKLGFELSDISNPQACIFKYNKDEASFAIRTLLEPIEEKELGIGVALWFRVSENVDELRAKFVASGITNIGTIMETPFGRAFHLKDIDGYKLTFLETE